MAGRYAVQVSWLAGGQAFDASAPGFVAMIPELQWLEMEVNQDSEGVIGQIVVGFMRDLAPPELRLTEPPKGE